MSTPEWQHAPERAEDVAWETRFYLRCLTLSRESGLGSILDASRLAMVAESEGKLRGLVFAWREAIEAAKAERLPITRDTIQHEGGAW